jgi:hypothetical protein
MGNESTHIHKLHVLSSTYEHVRWSNLLCVWEDSLKAQHLAVYSYAVRTAQSGWRIIETLGFSQGSKNTIRNVIKNTIVPSQTLRMHT